MDKKSSEQIASIIRGLGPIRATAEALGITKEAVYQWPRNGIPPAHFPCLARLSRGSVTIEQLYALNAKTRPDRGA